MRNTTRPTTVEPGHNISRVNNSPRILAISSSGSEPLNSMALPEMCQAQEILPVEMNNANFGDAPSTSLSTLKVLVVTSSSVQAADLLGALDARGHSTRCSSNGNEAESQLRT